MKSVKNMIRYLEFTRRVDTMKRFFKILSIIILSLLIILFLIFYTPDLKTEDLEDMYFTDHSSYLEVSILSLEEEPLSITVHFQDLGHPEDPVIVLIHGAFSSSHTFLPWAETLVNEGYRVIMPDLPYFGLSGGFEDKITSFRRSGEVVMAILEELDIESFHIAGNSLGGAVAWYITSEYPTHVLSLTLIDALPASLGEVEQERVPAFLTTDFFAGLVSQMTPKFLVRSVLKTAYGNPELLSEIIFERYLNLLRKEGTRKNILQVKQEAEPDWGYQDRLASITSPTFVLWGEKDSWIPVDVIDIFKEALSLSNDHIIIYPDLGHVPMEEDPSTVYDYLAFIDSLN